MISGIPQGSVLGPILFVIYINSLPTVANNSEIFLFADDTKIFKEITSPSNKIELQQDLDSMLQWTKDSLLQFHPDKCSSMTITRHPTTPRHYHLDDQELRISEEERDLGVILDPKLTFETHMWSKIKKANSIMGVIRRSFTYMDDPIFLSLYKSLVRPHLEYANQAWSPHLRKHIDSIENVQRRATKLIPNMRDLTYEERLRKLKLPTLTYRRLRGDLIEMYKIATGIYERDTCQALVDFSGRTSRGHKYKLTKSHIRSDIRKYSFKERVINPWNNLPSEVVEAPSLISFERRLDAYLGDCPIRYDHRAQMS